MKNRLPSFIALILISLGSQLQAQKPKNADFSEGKKGWVGDGDVVYIASDGSISEEESEEAVPAIAIELRGHDWEEIRQRLSPRADDTSTSIAIEVMVGEDFKPEKESRNYTDVDFQQGGQYLWSAEVTPKCDFLVRVRDEGWWYYRPIKLAKPGKWKKIKEKFPDLKSRQREISLMVPPGTGTVYIRGVE